MRFCKIYCFTVEIIESRKKINKHNHKETIQTAVSTEQNFVITRIEKNVTKYKSITINLTLKLRILSIIRFLFHTKIWRNPPVHKYTCINFFKIKNGATIKDGPPQFGPGSETLFQSGATRPLEVFEESDDFPDCKSA